MDYWLMWFFVFSIVCVVVMLVDAMHRRWAMLQAIKEVRAVAELEERKRKECQSTD